MTGKDVLTGKDLLEKAATTKKFEYSPLGKELKKQTSLAEKQYQSFDKVFNHDEKEEPVKIKKEGPLTTDESSLFYNNKYSFIEFKTVGKYMADSLLSRYFFIVNNYLASFKQQLKEFDKFTPRKLKTKAKKRTVYNNPQKLYNTLLSIYYNDYNVITGEEKEKMGKKYNPKNLLLNNQRFIELKKKEKSKSQPKESIAERVKLRRQKAYDKDLFDMSSVSNDDDSDETDLPPLEGDEQEVKEEKGLKILTPNKLLTRLPILLTQIKAGNNSYK